MSEEKEDKEIKTFEEFSEKFREFGNDMIGKFSNFMKTNEFMIYLKKLAEEMKDDPLLKEEFLDEYECRKNKEYSTDHLLSKCCESTVCFEPTNDGYSISVWCSKCENYLYTGRMESLIALWLGDLDGVKLNKGYIPDWIKERY